MREFTPHERISHASTACSGKVDALFWELSGRFGMSGWRTLSVGRYQARVVIAIRPTEDGEGSREARVTCRSGCENLRTRIRRNRQLRRKRDGLQSRLRNPGGGQLDHTAAQAEELRGLDFVACRALASVTVAIFEEMAMAHGLESPFAFFTESGPLSVPVRSELPPHRIGCNKPVASYQNCSGNVIGCTLNRRYCASIA
jgi:hypothetical protein